VVDYQRLGYGIRALCGVGRAEYARVVKLIEQTPEVVNAFNVTGEDSWILEIAVIDVEHLDAVVTKFCLMTETSTSIVLNMPRRTRRAAGAAGEHQAGDPRKVTAALGSSCDAARSPRAGGASARHVASTPRQRRRNASQLHPAQALPRNTTPTAAASPAASP
jgi:hypothetical protein